MISEIKGERSFDTLADVMEIAFSLAEDENVMEFVKRGEGIPEGEDALEWQMRIMKKCVPAMIRDHKDALASLIAISKNTTKAKYLKDVTPNELWKDVIAIFNDKTFIGFLS